MNRSSLKRSTERLPRGGLPPKLKRIWSSATTEKSSTRIEKCESCHKRSPRLDTFTCVAAKCCRRTYKSGCRIWHVPRLCSLCVCRQHAGHKSIAPLAPLADEGTVKNAVSELDALAKMLTKQFKLDKCHCKKPKNAPTLLGIDIAPIVAILKKHLDSVTKAIAYSTKPMLKDELKDKLTSAKELVAKAYSYIEEQQEKLNTAAEQCYSQIQNEISAQGSIN